ncbi:GSCOCT00009031001.2-RA-CDS [Cotesia congregata]|uniref:Sulfhydryl oxidase n=1 Tax=Cotesia congregata TaxID=51543 RepID=A0A8J2H955_COTCN|nr:GSCOCT00009031001.2-RA-CDS [Cotesia congregata]CAG5083297.1 Cc_p33_2a [Cotesia congregata]
MDSTSKEEKNELHPKQMLEDNYKNIKNNSEEDNHHEFHYKATLLRHTYNLNPERINEVQENFKKYLNIFLAYIRTDKPESADFFQRVTLGRFFKKLFMLITFVIHPINCDESLKQLNNMNDVTLCNTMLYEECREFFGLKSILEPKKLDQEEWSLDEWGKNYWNFLHALSILVQYEYQKDSNHPAMDYLALIMVNFHIILPCSVCSVHYKERNPLVNITLPILHGKDAIYVIYELHNIVRLRNGLVWFPIESFVKNWNLEILKSENVDIDITEPLS